ncbi:MAG: TonB-dependent receptor [Prevotella sp.]|nr:TonB-dependent receptor [Prevotella sp.]
MRCTVLLLFWCLALTGTFAQQLRLRGRVVDAENGQPVEYAAVRLQGSGLWAVTGADGRFTVSGVPAGRESISVQCLGYVKHEQALTIDTTMAELSIRLRPATLRVEEVTVTARRKQDEATTSYTIDRHALDQQQLLNISDVAVLLPGGKTTNPTLMNDSRMALRSGSQEMGNASFGTAIELDGLRLDNNGAVGETMAASTRTVSTADVESVEIVTGIPSVEYGDLSNGMVRVNSRRGASPFIVEGKLNQHTRQVALSKGLSLAGNGGVLNFSLEHARSFSDAASPHTAYQRNILSLRYSNTLLRNSTPLTLTAGLTGNIGGFNSEADPDEELDDYRKARDNALRANVNAEWQVARPWLTSLQLSAQLSLSDRKQEAYTHTSSASTQPYIHTTEEGYHIACTDPNGPIVLSPTGYWYVKSYSDMKPASWGVRLKAEQNRQWTMGRNGTPWRSHLKAGMQWSGSRNNGRGTYYADATTTPTWREYRYDRLPTMHNLAPYVEEKIIMPTTGTAQLELTAGLRWDITMISNSSYGTVGSLSPRFNSRYTLWRDRHDRLVSTMQVHAGWGKSVKLPSMQVLYPAPSYSDLLAFASTSTADNTSYYAYYTRPTAAQYNPALRWQHTLQTDIGLEMTIRDTRISLSAFHHNTRNSYMSARTYTPFTYRYTGQAAVQQSAIAADDRQFSIDPQTGTVTVSDRSGTLPAQQLAFTDRRTYTTNQHYTNASAVKRYGLEWIVDFAKIRALDTQLRIDGTYYHYKGIDDVLFADIPLGVGNIMSNGQPYPYVGYYRGCSVTTAGSSANASVSNGALSTQLSVNATITTHIPRIRLIAALRIESTLYSYRHALSEHADGSPRGYMLSEAGEYFGEPYDSNSRDKFVIVYPEYYTTWDNPTELLPFAERFLWARDNDQALYNDLSQLVVRSNYAYTMNPNRLSAYYSANLSVTKEIGDHLSVSFYANNFLNNMKRVHSSQTDLDTSLFESGYIPSYYYGLSVRLKI